LQYRDAGHTITPVDHADTRKQNQQYTTGIEGRIGRRFARRPASAAVRRENISINHASRVRSPRYWTRPAGRREITGSRRRPRHHGDRRNGRLTRRSAADQLTRDCINSSVRVAERCDASLHQHSAALLPTSSAVRFSHRLYCSVRPHTKYI